MFQRSPWFLTKFVSMALDAQRSQGLVLTVESLLFQATIQQVTWQSFIDVGGGPRTPGSKTKHSRQIEIHVQLGREISAASCSFVFPQSSSCLYFFNSLFNQFRIYFALLYEINN